eukprot:m.1352907 g.1352907  ORF g.1352907 m.1352907 type:complete len:796 (-) comp24928_c0_seq3:2270-4657(-)
MGGVLCEDDGLLQCPAQLVALLLLVFLVIVCIISYIHWRRHNLRIVDAQPRLDNGDEGANAAVEEGITNDADGEGKVAKSQYTLASTTFDINDDSGDGMDTNASSREYETSQGVLERALDQEVQGDDDVTGGTLTSDGDVVYDLGSGKDGPMYDRARPGSTDMSEDNDLATDKDDAATIYPPASAATSPQSLSAVQEETTSLVGTAKRKAPAYVTPPVFDGMKSVSIENVTDDIGGTSLSGDDSLAKQTEEISAPMPLYRPPLPSWMQPEKYNPWMTMQKRPVYRTVVCQRNSDGDLGFGLGLRDGFPVVRRTMPAWLPDTVQDGDEVLGVKGTPVENGNVGGLFAQAGLTGAGFSVDIIRYVVDVGTRPEPKPATESDIANIPTHLQKRLACDPTSAERLIGVIGELGALHVASVDDAARRKSLCARLLSAPDPASAALVARMEACPADHVVTSASSAPAARRLLDLEEGTIVRVVNKSTRGWWAGRADDGQTGWFPSHCVDPIPVSENVGGTHANTDGTTDTSAPIQGHARCIEAAPSDPLLRIPGWWERGDENPIDDIPWQQLLPARSRVCNARVTVTRVSGGAVLDKSYDLTFQDGSKSTIRVHFDGANDAAPKNDTGVVPTITEDHTPQPTPRSIETLHRYKTRFGGAIVQFCREHVGAVVCNGQCWSLVNSALVAADARPALGFNFGQTITELEANEGDIIVFQTCKFKGTRQGEDGKTQVYSATIGAPEHAAVIDSRAGRVYKVFECNVDKNQNVTRGTYNMMDLKEGVVQYYRALPNFSTIKPKHRK